jgi:hypothetical protein
MGFEDVHRVGEPSERRFLGGSLRVEVPERLVALLLKPEPLCLYGILCLLLGSGNLRFNSLSIAA